MRARLLLRSLCSLQKVALLQCGVCIPDFPLSPWMLDHSRDSFWCGHTLCFSWTGLLHYSRSSPCLAPRWRLGEKRESTTAFLVPRAHTPFGTSGLPRLQARSASLPLTATSTLCWPCTARSIVHWPTQSWYVLFVPLVSLMRSLVTSLPCYRPVCHTVAQNSLCRLCCAAASLSLPRLHRDVVDCVAGRWRVTTTVTPYLQCRPSPAVSRSLQSLA